MWLFKSIFWKPLVTLGLIALLSFCGYATGAKNQYEYSRFTTILLINAGFSSINVRTNSGFKLSWLLSGERECVKLPVSTSTSQRLIAQVGRSRVYIPSVEFVPDNSSTNSWTWIINDRLPIHSGLTLIPLSPPCKV